MATREEFEGYLDRLTADAGGTHHEIEPGLWTLRPGGDLEIDVIIHYSPPVVLIRVKVMDLPADAAEVATLSRKLLEWNATDLVHGSYGIAGGDVVLTEALELAHLDYEELLASYESMTLALASHLRDLTTFRGAR